MIRVGIVLTVVLGLSITHFNSTNKVEASDLPRAYMKCVTLDGASNIAGNQVLCVMPDGSGDRCMFFQSTKSGIAVSCWK